MKRTQVVLEKLSGTEYYGDLTVGDMIKFVPPTIVKEYDSITLASVINNMKGTGEKSQGISTEKVVKEFPSKSPRVKAPRIGYNG